MYPQSEESLLGGDDPLEPRREALSVKVDAEAELQKHRTRLMLVMHGAVISKVLVEAMCEYNEYPTSIADGWVD